jgi:hypothetical protein
MKKCTLSCLSILFFILTTLNLSAQQAGVTRCSTMEEDAIRRANNPNLGTLDDFENFLQAEIQKKQLAAQSGFVVGDVYIIPIVVHIIHNNEAVGTGLNISYDRINDQIVTLQNDFRKIAGSPGDNNHPDGADTKIEFRLAKQMPDGTAFPNGEDGVNRIYWDDVPGLTSPNNLSTTAVNGSYKPYTNGQGFSPDLYMNFWVCDLGGGLLGYAQFPSGGLPGMGCSNPNPVTDGVVMVTSSVGGSNFPSGAGPYNLGRTATHEIGHWLGLRHIWGDGGCGVDDFCADTPEASGSNFGCATGNISCGSTDMVENYMDYSDDACMNIFTNDQSIRMRTVLETTPVRSQLIQSTTWQEPIANSALVTHIESPFYELCNGDVEPKVLVSNVGTNVLNDVTIEYTIDGANTITTSFTGLGIAQGATTTLTLGTSTVTLGDHDISVKVTSPVVQATPETRNFTYTLGFGLPFVENFDNSASFPPASWQLGSSNNCFIWGAGSGTGASGTNTQAAAADNFNSNVVGEKAFLYTPILTMPCGATNVTLDFDIAYKSRGSRPNEGLEVEVSTDCGTTWQATSYSEFGTTLSNSTTSTTAYVPTTAAEWRHKTVNLDAFVNGGTDNQMLLRFVATNQNANVLYVDNVQVDATYNEVEVTQTGTQVYDGTTVSDFGTTLSNTPVVKTYTVKNTGTATLNLTNNLTVTGTEFTVGNFGSLTLSSGASTTFDVTYTAATVGINTATVSFGTNDCDEATFNFDVKGTAFTTCGITSLTSGTQTACNPVTNVYSQDVIVTYNNEPGSGNLVVAGQSFAITGSPQTVTLTGLNSNGNTVNVTANFSANTACTLTKANLFTAPASCVPCGITSLASGTQTACNPATNTYTQEVTVTYSNLGAPTSGDLVVAGQNFAIGTSPQMVTLTGLISDGNTVDVTANFSALPTCSATVVGLFTAPASCEPCVITSMTKGVQTACNPATNTYTQEVTIVYNTLGAPTSGSLVVGGQNFAITGSPQTVTLTNLIADGNSVTLNSHFSADVNCKLTRFNVFRAPDSCEPCSITNLASGTQTACDPLTNTYTQEVIVTYSTLGAPTSGSLVVGGQSFAITGSPQTVTLTNLNSDGNAVDVNANFSALPLCSATVVGLFTAPANCEPCAIVNMTVGTQTACNPVTNTYTQEVIVTYTKNPTSGSLVVGGQSFAITGSPQTVTLTNLTSDGNAVDIDANFSADTNCKLTKLNLFTAPVSCIPCGITNLASGTQTACNPATNTYTQEVIVTYSTLGAPTSGSLVVGGQSFAITGSPQTVTLSNLTSDGNAVDVNANFSALPLCSATVVGLFTAPANCEPCAMVNMTVGTQTACNPATNTYTQEVIVTYTKNPTSGSLVVGGQNFAITGSPQTVTLTNLTSDGNAVDIDANFSADTNCKLTKLNLFTAPVNCEPCGITSLASGTQTACNPATNTYTQEVIVTYTKNPTSGNLVVDGQNFAITGSPQTVTLTNLTSDGNAVNVTANFSTLPVCSATVLGLFTAPADCTAPEITVSNVLNGNTLSLGTTLIGTDVTRTMTITNDGSANLDITSVSISGHPDFTIQNPLVTPLSILPAQTASFDVKMDATVIGVKTATIIIMNNDADEANFTFNVQGTVIPNNPPPPPPAIDYTIIAPSDLTGVSVSTSQINLSWLDNSDNEDGFYVYQNGILIATLASGSTSFEVLGLDPNTVYTFRLRAFNSQERANSNTLTIATLPITPSFAESVGVCGTSGVASLKLTGAPQGASYRWYTDATGGTPIAEINNELFVTPIITETTTFYATVVSSTGMESSPRIAVQAEVFEAVNAELTEGKTVLVCDAETTLHAITQTGAAYQWRLNGTLTSQTGQEFIATTSGNYQLIVTRNDCSDTYDFSVTLNYQPTATIANGNTVDFCQSGVLSATNLNANASYQWLENGNVIASGTSVTVSQSGTYTLRVTENTCVNEANTSVNVFELPQNQVITASATQFCVGDFAELSVPVINGVNYQWFRNGVRISGAKSETHKAYQSGEYSVEMSVDNLDCEVLSQSLAVSWFVSPEVKLTKDDKTLILDISIPHQSVQWFTTGAVEATQFANQTSLSAPPYETYWAIITYQTGCAVTSNSLRFFEEGTTGGNGGGTPTGLDDDQDEGGTFEVFPNPSQSGIFQVRLSGTFDADAHLKLSDALGRDLNINITIQQGAETLQVDLSEFASGVYHLQFISSEGTLTKKIIKK